MPDPQTLLLVGAGHTHLHLLRHADRLRAAGWTVVLLAPRWFDYSGVGSAVATGALPLEAGRLDVAALAARERRTPPRGARWRDLDPRARVATTATGQRLAYDVVSIGIGSVTSDLGVPVGAGVVAVKPLAGLQTLADRLPDDGAAVGHRVGAGPLGARARRPARGACRGAPGCGSSTAATWSAPSLPPARGATSSGCSPARRRGAPDRPGRAPRARPA